MEALSVTDYRVHNVEVSARAEKVDRRLVTQPQQAGSAGDAGLVNDDGDIRRVHANEHHATPARSRTGGRR